MIDSDCNYFQGTPTTVLSGKKPGEEGEEEEEVKQEEEAGSEGENAEVKAKDSNETSEEEVKVPTRPLTGK